MPKGERATLTGENSSRWLEDHIRGSIQNAKEDNELKQIKVRFAPSPTGPLHIGGARSALFNWLFARHYGGKFLVRIEDTDLERSSRESEENILDSLTWLGLDWDEGIGVGGPGGPYRQTERLDLYHKYAHQLLEQGHAYYCYCTEEELAAEREALLSAGEMVRYLGRCRNLGSEDRARLENEGRRTVLRFKIPDERVVTVADQVRGQVKFECSGMGDFIILKSDGVPTYNFAVVVDDHLMDITHVLRAEEHLSNTPRQILLCEALGWESPAFAHISLILGKDRSKMSKRHGATAIEQYQALGYLPEALVNFMALLGWSPGGEEEVFTLVQLQEQFSLDRVAKNPAVFDLDKLNWLNGFYIRQSSLDRVTSLAIPFLQRAGYLSSDVTPEELAWAKLLVTATREYLANMSEITSHVSMFFQDPDYSEADVRAVLEQEQVATVLGAIKDKLSEAFEQKVLDEQVVKEFLKKLPKELGVGGKKIYLPLRAALTGRTKGPELYHIIPVLGLKRAVIRLERALKFIG